MVIGLIGLLFIFYLIGFWPSVVIAVVLLVLYGAGVLKVYRPPVVDADQQREDEIAELRARLRRLEGDV